MELNKWRSPSPDLEHPPRCPAGAGLRHRHVLSVSLLRGPGWLLRISREENKGKEKSGELLSENTAGLHARGITRIVRCHAGARVLRSAGWLLLVYQWGAERSLSVRPAKRR